MSFCTTDPEPVTPGILIVRIGKEWSAIGPRRDLRYILHKHRGVKSGILRIAAIDGVSSTIPSSRVRCGAPALSKGGVGVHGLLHRDCERMIPQQQRLPRRSY